MKDGKRWYVFVRYKDWTGEIKQHKKEGFDRRADAKNYEKHFLEQRQGSADMSINSLYKLYMEDCKTHLKPTTYSNKDFLFQKHVIPYLGKLQACKVSPANIRKWQNTLLSIKREDTG
ncbi:MAG: Arm DNA-binding domain-containing protein [Clostridiaceae bacterium]|nr:Arm DNA-binding domain-containing protein [Clostridiaceae bacterium]